MQSNKHDTLINTESSLRAYFHEAIERASDKNHVEASEHTLWYLTNLLHNYSRTEYVFDFHRDGGTLTPLVEYYQQALEAENDQRRRQYLQRLGDVAMFISGLFAPALERRAVGVNYYVAMGENAYGFLADTAGETTKEKVLGEVFNELSNHFSSYVSVLSSVAPANKKSNRCENLLQVFDQWQQTADPHLEQQLKQKGVIFAAISDAEH